MKYDAVVTGCSFGGMRDLVQDPETAEYSVAPKASLKETDAGRIIRLEELTPLLNGLLREKRC